MVDDDELMEDDSVQEPINSELPTLRIVWGKDQGDLITERATILRRIREKDQDDLIIERAITEVRCHYPASSQFALLDEDVKRAQLEHWYNQHLAGQNICLEAGMVLVFPTSYGNTQSGDMYIGVEEDSANNQ